MDEFCFVNAFLFFKIKLIIDSIRLLSYELGFDFSETKVTSERINFNHIIYVRQFIILQINHQFNQKQIKQHLAARTAYHKEKIQKMGNSTANAQYSTQTLCKYWEPIGPFLFRNKATQQIIRQKKMTFRTQEEMKYVFNCLLKRMNNYHSNVIKIFYLKKIAEPDSLCHCGVKFTILVYLENVQSTLQAFISQQGIATQKSNISDINRSLLRNLHTTGTLKYNGRCICMNIAKGLNYLKQKYGCFRISNKNVWVQFYQQKFPNQSQSFQDNHWQSGKYNSVAGNYNSGAGNYTSGAVSYNSGAVNENTLIYQQKNKQIKQSLTVKIWISQQEEQNFPDESCTERQMCISLITLINTSLIPAKLCKCYSNLQMTNKLNYVHHLKELTERIKNDHQITQNRSLSQYSQVEHMAVFKSQNLVPARTIRSFSSNQPIFMPNVQGSHQNQRNILHLQAQRKYSSIQITRKPNQSQALNSTKRMVKAQFFMPQNFKRPQQGNNRSFQIQYKPANRRIQQIITQKLVQTNQRQNPVSLVTFKQVKGQFINSKIKFRNGNNITSKPMVGFSNPVNIKEKPQTLTHNSFSFRVDLRPNNQKIETVMKQHAYPVKLISDRVKNIPKVNFDIKSNFTDRTKNDYSAKDQSKKQVSAINSSRNNISITPISLDSTYGAGSSLRPIDISNNLRNKQKSINEQLDMDILSSQVSKQTPQAKSSKKQSGSSSKSQQGRYVCYQEDLNRNDARQINFVKKRMSNQYQPQQVGCVDILEQSLQKSKTSSFLNKIQVLGLGLNSNQLIRLRQSEFMSSGPNSYVNSKKQSKKQSKQPSQKYSQKSQVQQRLQISRQILKASQRVQASQKIQASHGVSAPQKLLISQKLSSLAEMQANFNTRQYIQDFHYSRQQSDLKAQEVKQKKNTKNDISEPNLSKHSSQKLYLFQDQSRLRNLAGKLICQIADQSKQLLDQERQSIQKASSDIFPNQANFNIEPQFYEAEEVSSLIMRQQQEPLHYVTQEQYRIKISLSNQCLNPAQNHHKKLSNPTFDKSPMSKNKSLKEEFRNFLDFPKQNSLKAMSQNKQVIASLNENQVRQTYSIYNQSQYNNSNMMSKKNSQKQTLLLNPGIPRDNGSKNSNKNEKVRKPVSKQEIEREIHEKKSNMRKEAQTLLRLTSSGHEDNSIKQKVRNKKAQFAQLKNEMNNLLL